MYFHLVCIEFSFLFLLLWLRVWPSQQNPTTVTTTALGICLILVLFIQFLSHCLRHLSLYVAVAVAVAECSCTTANNVCAFLNCTPQYIYVVRCLYHTQSAALSHSDEHLQSTTPIVCTSVDSRFGSSTSYTSYCCFFFPSVSHVIFIQRNRLCK